MRPALRIDDSSGLIRKLVDAILAGSGALAPVNVRTDGTVKNTDLRPVMGATGTRSGH